VTVIEQMLKKYTINDVNDQKHAIKEIVQEVVLAGLARTDFFKYAAFYGGTALRIFYGLNRFSEDLDFTLLSPSNNFEFKKYISAIQNMVESLGLVFKAKEKKKSHNATVKSAFLKGNTKEQLLIFYPSSNFRDKIHDNEKIKIKFEIDVNPPLHATTEFKYRLLPNNYKIRIYDESSLFAGKLHAVLARKWKTRIKGRDFYDYIFYISQNIAVNLLHLESRLKQTNTIDMDFVLTLDSLKKLLFKRFDEIDYEAAKLDVIPFIKDTSDLDLWSAEFFKEITKNIKAI